MADTEDEEDIILPGPNTTADIVVGVLIAVCATVCLVGNTTSLLYFWGRKRKSVHNMLYLIITSVDISAGLSAIFTSAALFNRREPGLLGNTLFCTQWFIVVTFACRMSMFLVVLISVTRTINIVFPFFKVQYLHLVYSVLVYGAWLLVVDGVMFGTKVLIPGYFPQIAGCFALAPTVNGIIQAPPAVMMFWFIVIQIELMVPSIVVFISFTASTITLFKKKTPTSSKDKKFRRASITISMFTATFLVCNIPCFLYQLNRTLYRSSGNKLGISPDQTGQFQWYSSLVLQFFTTYLNAACNPCLYFLRMSPMIQWLRNVLAERFCRCCNMARNVWLVPVGSTSEEK